MIVGVEWERRKNVKSDLIEPNLTLLFLLHFGPHGSVFVLILADQLIFLQCVSVFPHFECSKVLVFALFFSFYNVPHYLFFFRAMLAIFPLALTGGALCSARYFFSFSLSLRRGCERVFFSLLFLEEGKSIV